MAESGRGSRHWSRPGVPLSMADIATIIVAALLVAFLAAINGSTMGL
jgi:hypothetical protein